MGKNKKLLKSLTIYIVSFLFICLLPIQSYAMKHAHCDSSPSTDQSLEKKPPELPVLWSPPASVSRADDAMEIDSPTPIYPLSPEPPDLTKIFDISTLYNHFNGCKTLRVDPNHDFTPDQKLDVVCFKNFLEYRRQEIFNKFNIIDLASRSIFKVFDIICIDNRIKTEPRQFLSPYDWLILRHGLNATVYINRNHLKMRSEQQPNALNTILFFALYMS